jgi:hypothetical protein
VVRASLAGKVTRQGLQSAIAMAGAMKRESLVPLIKAALDKLPPEAVSAYAVNPASLPKYVGNYRDAASGISMAVTLQGESLMLQVQGQPMVRLVRPPKTCSGRRGQCDADVQRTRRVSSNRSAWCRDRRT